MSCGLGGTNGGLKVSWISSKSVHHNKHILEISFVSKTNNFTIKMREEVSSFKFQQHLVLKTFIHSLGTRKTSGWWLVVFCPFP
jgi:hypothetical protein